MDYKCSLCGKIVPEDLKAFIDHTEGHIVGVIKDKHPEWVEHDGMCHKCLDYFRQQMRGDRGDGK